MSNVSNVAQPCLFKTTLRLLLFLLLSGGGLRAGDQTNGVATSDITFESFLKNPPIIEQADFEIYNAPPPPEMVENRRKEIETAMKREGKTKYEISPPITNIFCSLKCDGTNYVLCRSNFDGYSGQFGQVGWKLDNGILRLVDASVSTPTADWLIDQAESRSAVNRLMSFGIQQMVPGTVKWATGSSQFSAVAERVDIGDDRTNPVSDGQIDVKVTSAEGRPEAADAKDTWGREIVIRYKYDRLFFSGRLPVEFTAMTPHGDNPRTVFTLKIRDLRLSTNFLSTAELDPRKFLAGQFKSILYESNGIVYSKTLKGIAREVVSPEVGAARRAKRLAESHRGVVIATIAILAALILPVVFAGCYWFANRHK